ncbi:fatty acid--CoA ligase family protein [Streptomyces sp. M19]
MAGTSDVPPGAHAYDDLAVTDPGTHAPMTSAWTRWPGCSTHPAPPDAPRGAVHPAQLPLVGRLQLRAHPGPAPGRPGGVAAAAVPQPVPHRLRAVGDLRRSHRPHHRGQFPDDVLDLLRTERATFLAGVPTTYHHLVTTARRTGLSLPDLRIGLVGGAVTGSELRRSFEETFGVPLVDAYGSTETCGAITMNPPDGARVDGSCGLPVPGVDVRIVDPDTGDDAPAGKEGEVWVSGPNVMVGYHNSPEATGPRCATAGSAPATWPAGTRPGTSPSAADSRTSSSAAARTSTRRGRSGPAHRPGVADAGVAGAAHDTLGEVPVAWLVPGPDGLDIAAVLDHCRARLSAYKIPERIHEAAGIPRTPPGRSSGGSSPPSRTGRATRPTATTTPC